MSLQVNYTIDQPIGCTNFILIDDTGDYNVGTNPNGYGTPNPTRASITSALADITLPGGTVITGIVCTLPTSGNTQTNITQAILGVTGSSLTDGIYRVRYYVSDGINTYDIIKDFTYYCNVQCCKDKVIAEITVDDCCDCDNELLDTADQIDWYIQASIAAVNCNKLVRGKKLLDAATFLCAQKKCNCTRQ